MGWRSLRVVPVARQPKLREAGSKLPEETLGTASEVVSGHPALGVWPEGNWHSFGTQEPRPASPGLSLSVPYILTASASQVGQTLIQ